MFEQMENFDIKKVLPVDKTPIVVDEVTKTTESLADALKAKKLTEDMIMLVTEFKGRSFVFPLQMMVVHGTVQGTLEGDPWLVAFCTVCNAGGCFNPQIGDKVHTFVGNGLYDAMLLLSDQETGSRWNHINGMCLYGEHEAKQLKKLSTLQFMSAKQALKSHPEALYVVPQEGEAEQLDDMNARIKESESQIESDGAQSTMGTKVDERLHRMTLGIGVWTEDTSRFYPLREIFNKHNALIDEVGVRKVLVYIEPGTAVPFVFYVDADNAIWDRNTIDLGNGQRIIETAMLNAEGKRVPLDYPSQLFARWYSFAIAFPGSQISGMETSSKKPAPAST